jgi:hypothetical protein
MTAITHPIVSTHHMVGVLVTAALAVGLSVTLTLALVSTKSPATSDMSQRMTGKTSQTAQQLDPGAFLTPAQEKAVTTGR